MLLLYANVCLMACEISPTLYSQFLPPMACTNVKLCALLLFSFVILQITCGREANCLAKHQVIRMTYIIEDQSLVRNCYLVAISQNWISKKSQLKNSALTASAIPSWRAGKLCLGVKLLFDQNISHSTPVATLKNNWLNHSVVSNGRSMLYSENGNATYKLGHENN